MAKKMPRKLVALGASAIAVVYAAGYVETLDADSRFAATVESALQGPTGSVAGTLLTGPTSSPYSAQLRPGAPLPSLAAGAASYHNGTYHGVGASRRGAVAVTLEVQGGRVTTVTITKANTPYPISRIEALPDQVILRQSLQIDRVSGATYSTIAFLAAVEQALSQAQEGQASAPAAPALLPPPPSEFPHSRTPVFRNPE